MNDKKKSNGKEKEVLKSKTGNYLLDTKGFRYYAIIVIRAGVGYEFVRRKKITASTTHISVGKNKSQIVNTSKPSYRKGLRKFYYIEINEGQIWFDGSNKSTHPEYIDMILKKGVIKQLTSTLNAKLFSSNVIIMGIIGIVLGIFLGLFIAGFL